MRQLSTEQIKSFIKDGFIKIDNAFPNEIADQCRAILWEATQCDPENPASWTQPVIRIGELGHEPFKNAVNTETLHNAFDQLAGKDSWIPRETVGTFPIRFPGKEAANDTGWHVDASFPGEDPNNYFDWRININSKGRALLMLFLFSDVSVTDAPTIIRAGSHADVARLLEPEGENGLGCMALAERLDSLPIREQVLATGDAGTVYLCHPFLVHRGQDIRGTRPKFMAQPALLTKKDYDINRSRDQLCPVEMAIVNGLLSLSNVSRKF